MNITELQEILTKLNINITARQISRIWGMDEASFSRKKRLGSEIKYENIKQLEQALNITLTSNNPQINVNSLSSDIIKIPYWSGLPEDLRNPDFSCVTAEKNVIVNHWYFKPECLFIVPMVGDKMAHYWYPMADKDILIVNTEQNYIMGNGVYFATSRNNTRFWIREMQALINDDIQIKSFAPSGETTKVFTPQQLAEVDFKIIGKVIKNVSFRL